MSPRLNLQGFRRSLGRLSPLVADRRASIVAIVGCALGAGLAEAVVLALIAFIATTMSTQGDGGSSLTLGPLSVAPSIPLLLLVAAVLAVVRLSLQLILAYLPARMSGRVQTRLRTDLVRSFLAASWTTKAKEKEGQLQELIGAQVTQAGNAILMLTAGLAAGLEFLTLVVSALVLSVMVSVIVIVTAGILFACLRPLSRRVRQRAHATSESSVRLASGVAESVRMAEEIHALGVSEAERSRIERLIDRLEVNLISTKSLSRMVPVLYQSSVILLLVAGLAVLYTIGTTRLAALGAVVLLLVRASAYGQQMQVAYQGLGEALPYLDRVTVAVERFRSDAAHAGDLQVGAIDVLEVRDLSFAYTRGTPTLRGISFSIRSGEAVGVIGPSGAGKSTLLQVLLRLREPTGGVYLVDGVPARDLQEQEWHRRVAFLPQEPHVLNASVSENIRFFRDRIDDDALERAAKLAHIHDDVVAWPDGYDTIIGQRANAVSGGQRQRLCLARALAGSPDILLLDEPTSALDARSERLIQESLRDLRGEVSLILVAHRLTTLSLCDRVMVLRDGRLESFDSADALYGSNEFFRQSVDIGAAGVTPP